MATKKNIYLGDHAERILNTPGKPESISGRINSIIIRYDSAWRDACPALTVAEWCAICDANNGTVFPADSPTTDPARYAWMNVQDAEELDEKWGIDRLDLARRIQEMTTIEQCAAMEVITAFWQTTAGKGETYEQILQRIGANIKG